MSPAKVTLKEQFPGAPDKLLTQKLTARFPVAGGSLGAVSLRELRAEEEEALVGLTAQMPRSNE